MDSVESKRERICALKTGNGIQYLLNEGYKILGNPILVHDMAYEVVSFTEDIVTDDPIWNEYVTTGTVSTYWLDFFKNESFIYTAANAKKITFLTSEKLRSNRAFIKLFSSENIQIGCACVIEGDNPFLERSPELFEVLSDKLNEELAGSEYYRSYGQAYQEIMINKLIAGEIEDKEAYAAHVESIYISLKAYLVLFVADVSQCDHRYNDLVYLRDLLKRAQPDFKYSIYKNYIVIVANFEKAISNVDESLNKLHKIFKRNNIYVGMSGNFENLFELPKYYDEAIKALNYGMKSGNAGRIYLYAEVAANEQ